MSKWSVNQAVLQTIFLTKAEVSSYWKGYLVKIWNINGLDLANNYFFSKSGIRLIDQRGLETLLLGLVKVRVRIYFAFLDY